MSVNVETRAYYRLPVSILVDPGCLGASVPIDILGFEGTLYFPGVEWNKENRPYLTRPAISDIAYERLKQYEHDYPSLWGSINSWHPKNKTFEAVHISSFLCTLTLDVGSITYSEYLYGRGHPISAEVTTLGQNIDEWFGELCLWIAVKTKQDLNISNPLSSLKMPGAGLKIWTEDDGTTSLFATPNIIVTNVDGNAADKVLRKADLEKIIDAIKNGKRPPLSHLLLNEAREASLRGQPRKGAVDAGSAVETTLRDHVLANSIAISSPRPTLGTYIRAVPGLPTDTETKLLDVRNDAQHYNISFDPTRVPDALAIATHIVESLDPLVL